MSRRCGLEGLRCVRVAVLVACGQVAALRLVNERRLKSSRNPRRRVEAEVKDESFATIETPASCATNLDAYTITRDVSVTNHRVEAVFGRSGATSPRQMVRRCVA